MKNNTRAILGWGEGMREEDEGRRGEEEREVRR